MGAKALPGYQFKIEVVDKLHNEEKANLFLSQPFNRGVVKVVVRLQLTEVYVHSSVSFFLLLYPKRELLPYMNMILPFVRELVKTTILERD